MNQSPTMFKIKINNCLKTEVNGYFNVNYYRKGEPNNPDYLWKIKNEYNDFFPNIIEDCKNDIRNIFRNDLPQIMQLENINNCICVVVPRSKQVNYYQESQLQFKEAIREACQQVVGVEDGIDAIFRHTDTFTTHRGHAKGDDSMPNEGEKPYPGITVNTCNINQNAIVGKTVILVDDIYTKTVNIDEDCIQAMLDNGASRVIFYSIGKTVHKNKIYEGSTDIALQILAAKELGIITDKMNFWSNYSTIEKFNTLLSYNPQIFEKVLELKSEFEDGDNGITSVICPFDAEFIELKQELLIDEKPILLFCRGDVSLLKNPTNISIVGLQNPTDEVKARENNLVNSIISADKVIVAGLYNHGCGIEALDICMANQVKTIAVSHYPLSSKTSQRTRDIIENGGLIVTEYFNENDMQNRINFLKVEHLSALLSFRVVLIASFIDKDSKDFYSCRAMEMGGRLGLKMSVMFNPETDSDDPMFALNKELFESRKAKGARY